MPAFQKAFILIKVSPGREQDVINELMAIPEVKEVHVVPGDWDILAVVSAQKDFLVPSDERVYRLVMEKIEKIRHVQDTSTMVSQFSKSK